MGISQEFIQSIILLLLTAVVTGFLIPYIFRIIDQDKAKKQKEEDARKQREQKSFEADLARQAKLIDYQIALFDEMTETIWKYWSISLEITNYKWRNEEKGYKSALKNYDAEAPKLLNEILIQISKVRRFVSNSFYQELREFYHVTLINNIDVRLIRLSKTEDLSDDDWVKAHSITYVDVADKINDILLLLAKNLHLTDIQ